MKTEEIEKVCSKCLHWPVCHRAFVVHENARCRFCAGGQYSLFCYKGEYAEPAALKESEKRAIRLCETIWHRQWSNPEDCLMDAIDLMKTIDPDHPMVTAKTFRETIAAKKDSYIALRKANEKLREGLNLIERQVAHIGGNRKFRLGTVYGIKCCAEIAESYLGEGDDS